MRKAISLFITVLLISPLAASGELDNNPDVGRMQRALVLTVLEMNEYGRLPANGILGGTVNNLKQMIKPGNLNLGCAGQTDYLYSKLTSLNMIGWQFEERYEYGTNSPIFIPHQWVTAYSVNGQVVDLDPWLNRVTVRMR